MTLVTVYKKHEHAEPEFIERLADLSGLKHLNVPWPIYLHAQLYYVRADNSYFAILGLANIASDRLWKNEELSSKFYGAIDDFEHKTDRGVSAEAVCFKVGLQ